MVVPVSERGYVRPELLAETDWLAARLDGSSVRVIDTRSEDAYAAGHIPGAIHLAPGIGGLRQGPGMPEPAAFAQLAGSFGIDENVTVVLYDDRGPTAGQSAWAFRYYGHAATRFLDGGWNKWTAEDRPISSEVPAFDARTFTPQLDKSTYCDLPQAKAAIDDPRVVVWDTRTREEFEGTLARGNPEDRLGHLPGAVHLDWVELLDAETRTLKPAAELAPLLAAHGITPESVIAAY
jgi:thiosulfate/3-mercaptopyruvate sulfurtransferase